MDLARSNFARNPYNFAGWEDKGPWLPAAGANDAASHRRYAQGRFSGILTVKLEAKTPIFVPAGDPRLRVQQEGVRDMTPRHAWKCRRFDGAERFGLPGSTMKGVVRTLFEAWTNSRLGIGPAPDKPDDIYDLPIPYRRRTAMAWVISGIADADGSIPVFKAGVRFALKTSGGSWRVRAGGGQGVLTNWTGALPKEMADGPVDPTNTNDWQAVPYRANLLWSLGNLHKYSHLAVLVTETKSTIPPGVKQAYLDNLDHRAYREHPDRVEPLEYAPRDGARDHYKRIDIEKEQLGDSLFDLRRLGPGEIIFGLERDGEIVCFGKNVNFLWPSEHSPRELVGAFAPPARLSLATADAAEATFGFVSKHEGTVSPPFRGRVRFETFWAAEDTREMSEVALKPLTSPTGIKLKARPLYLAPNGSACATYSDQAPKLRGRKLYWHQKAEQANGIDQQHRWTGNAGDQGASQCPPPIHPLPAGTSFQGRVHFDNLTPEELGALVVSIAPDRFPWKEKGVYGIKIGKAKPRGFGSVVATELSLALRRDGAQAYAALDATTLSAAPQDLTAAVTKFAAWLDTKAKALGRADRYELPFVADLARLLRLPSASATFFRDYHDKPAHYGWMPGFDDPDGEPSPGQPRPIPMPLARDTGVP